jgi:hypothetical protein
MGSTPLARAHKGYEQEGEKLSQAEKKSGAKPLFLDGACLLAVIP